MSEPFPSTAEAWFWTMRAIQARRMGERPGADFDGMTRPCEPDDIVSILDRLYRQRRINLEHARMLRMWGERGQAPPRDVADARVWREAIVALDVPLRARGIVSSIGNVIQLPRARHG